MAAETSAPVLAYESAADGARTGALRRRVLFWTTAGYGIFYFVRKNIPIAIPIMMSQLGLRPEQIGSMLTGSDLVYGVSKFGNAVIVDRSSARRMMILGLVLSALMNVLFGMQSAFTVLCVYWLLNGWFQGMGYPPCARLLTHWFSKKELATKMAIWNASHTIGGAGVLILGGYLIDRYMNWRVAFFVPAGIALVVALLMYFRLPDTPEAMGLPEVSGTAEPRPADESYTRMLYAKVFSNKYIWIVSIANFFVYTIRLSVLNWGPTMLQARGIKLTTAAWQTAGFEAGGLVCMLLTGWMTDKFFSGRGAPLSLLCMVLAGVSILLFWKVAGTSRWLNSTLLVAMGFFIYGPQALVAVIVAQLASKRAAATAVGLTSIFGYASTVLSGWGIGALIGHPRLGWNVVFACLIGVAAIGAALFALALPAQGHQMDAPA